jgi:hypothetical protein
MIPADNSCVFDHTLVFATISAAVAAWALAEILRSRVLWAAGAALAAIHSVAAFGVFYNWSHDTARELTMRQTAALTGVNFSGGIYVNYAFLAVWIADAVWRLAAPMSYQRRPRTLTLAVHGFIFFIIVNGAVVFADGWARILGGVAVSAVALAWVVRPIQNAKFTVQNARLDR